MTALFRSVPITSAEHADALPEGTIIHGTNPSMGNRKSVAVKHGGDWWGDDCDVNFLGNSGKVGWTALVPIEAEEETVVRWDDPSDLSHVESRQQAREIVDGHEPWEDGTPVALTRLVTPWEEA